MLTVYRNGFTLDDGELQASGVPENDEFLRLVAEGEWNGVDHRFFG